MRLADCFIFEARRHPEWKLIVCGIHQSELLRVLSMMKIKPVQVRVLEDMQRACVCVLPCLGESAQLW